MVLLRLLPIGIATSVKYVSFMVTLSALRPVNCYGLFDQVFWTDRSIVYSWNSLTRIVAHIYNRALVVPLTVHI